MIALQNYKIGSTVVEPLARANIRRKATVKKRRNMAPGFIRLDPKLLFKVPPNAVAGGFPHFTSGP